MFGQRVIRLPGERNCALRVGDCLYRGRIERQDHHANAVGIHLRNQPGLDVDEAGAQLGPDMRAEHLRIAKRCLDGEMLFECDLVLHDASPGRA